MVQLGDGHDWFRGRGGDDAAQGMGGVDRLLGDRGADSLDGGAGADVLHGGRDLDLLTGGAGADSFVFGRVYAAGDVITDMTSGQDHIVLGARILGFALAAGVVDDSHFHLDLAEGTAGQFVYRAGQLIWDSNGTDADGEILIATLTGAPVLVAGDLTVIG